jgi:cytochrome oxidase Cu insertion factor (SCO1/SenC/PrrC family)
MKKFIPIASTLIAISLLSGCGSKSSDSSMGGMKMSHPTASPSNAGMASAAPGGGSFLSQPIPADVMNTELFDSNGKAFSLSSLMGQTVVIADFLTSCHEICPMTTANMRQIGDAVAASSAKAKIKVVEISVDAGRDTASRLAAYKSLFNDENFIIASGTEANLKKFWDFFGAQATKSPYTAAELKNLPLDWQTGKPNTYDVSHTDEVLIVDAKGNWSWLDLGNPNPGKATIPTKLKSYLSEDGLNNLAKPQEPSWDAKAVLSALSTISGIKVGA